MVRVALVAPDDGALTAVLGAVGRAGVVELEGLDEAPPGAVEPELARVGAAAVRQAGVAAYVGWCPAPEVPKLAAVLAPLDGALVALPAPRGVDPPTLLRAANPVRRELSALVETYGIVPYADVDPTVLAAVAYVVMFGMMFADAGHGLVLLAAAVALRAGWPRRLASLHQHWPFVAGAGLASAGFGVLFGEFFGPTGVVPTLWLEPLDQPVRLLAAGIGLGGVLLAIAYAVAVVNRWREGSARLALYAPSGIAGAALFAGLGGLAAGVYFDSAAATVSGALVAAGALVLAGIGLYAGAGGGGAGLTQTLIQLFDLVIRLGANLVSFARLAAFGLTHAALGGLVWAGTAALWHGGGWGLAGAVVVFAVGNAVTFGLEALVAGVQALRLEYYELFSRVFETTGRPFRPWRLEEVPR
jgi:V/A-type H+-transporting ATPase subunit I